MLAAVPNVNVLFPGWTTATVRHLPHKPLEHERVKILSALSFFGLTTDDADDFVATALCAVS
jgi:hypothetical protein